MQGQMELGIIPLDGMEKLVDADLRGQLFADLAQKRLLRRLARLHFPARELPPVLERAIPALGGEDPVPFPDDGGNDFDSLHFFCRDGDNVGSILV